MRVIALNLSLTRAAVQSVLRPIFKSKTRQCTYRSMTFHTSHLSLFNLRTEQLLADSFDRYQDIWLHVSRIHPSIYGNVIVSQTQAGLWRNTRNSPSLVLGGLHGRRWSPWGGTPALSPHLSGPDLGPVQKFGIMRNCQRDAIPNLWLLFLFPVILNHPLLSFLFCSRFK